MFWLLLGGVCIVVLYMCIFVLTKRIEKLEEEARQQRASRYIR